MDTVLEPVWQKSKDKEFSRLFWNKFSVSDFTTLTFPPDLSCAENMVRVIKGKIIWKGSDEKQKYFELAGSSSYRG